MGSVILKHVLNYSRFDLCTSLVIFCNIMDWFDLSKSCTSPVIFCYIMDWLIFQGLVHLQYFSVILWIGLYMAVIFSNIMDWFDF